MAWNWISAPGLEWVISSSAGMLSPDRPATLQPVERALAQGLYGAWEPSAGDVDRLNAIFPSGVCDYSKGDLMVPPELSGSANGAKK